jgi:FRG domain/SET domain
MQAWLSSQTIASLNITMREFGPIHSVSELLDVVSGLTTDWRREYQDRWPHTDELEWTPWFRGESDADIDTALQPKLYRPYLKQRNKLGLLLHEEQELRLEFERCGLQLFRDGRPSNFWDWYFLMAHAGVPTRLLDWTDSALTALYFALENRFGEAGPKVEADAAVYMLDAWWLNDFAFTEADPHTPADDRAAGLALQNWPEAKRYLPEDPLKTDKNKIRARCPLAIEPSHIWQRLAAQRSHFTVFGKEMAGLSPLADKKNARLIRIRVDTREIDSIQHDLRAAGTSRSIIFPDIDGLGAELNLAFTYRCRVSAERDRVVRKLVPSAMQLKSSTTKSMGVGVFAIRNLKKGARVADGISWWDFLHPVPWAFMKNQPAGIQKLVDAFCVGTPDGFIPPPDFDFDLLSVEWYLNHSCSGNLGFDHRGDFVARRNISAGEELTYDYGLVESNPNFRMNCKCRSSRCRKIITGRDWKKEGLFTDADLEFMLPWLREKLKKRTSESPRPTTPRLKDR